jgi:hypothetical protein
MSLYADESGAKECIDGHGRDEEVVCENHFRLNAKSFEDIIPMLIDVASAYGHLAVQSAEWLSPCVSERTDRLSVACKIAWNFKPRKDKMHMHFLDIIDNTVGLDYKFASTGGRYHGGYLLIDLEQFPHLHALYLEREMLTEKRNAYTEELCRRQIHLRQGASAYAEAQKNVKDLRLEVSELEIKLKSAKRSLSCAIKMHSGLYSRQNAGDVKLGEEFQYDKNRLEQLDHLMPGLS